MTTSHGDPRRRKASVAKANQRGRQDRDPSHELIVTVDVAATASEQFLALRPRTLALAGGSTPRRLYERLTLCEYPWSETEIFFGDERCVSPDHPDSNYRMARDALLSRVPAGCTECPVRRATRRPMRRISDRCSAPTSRSSTWSSWGWARTAIRHPSSRRQGPRSDEGAGRPGPASGPRTPDTDPAGALRRSGCPVPGVWRSKREALRRLLAGDDIPPPAYGQSGS